MANQQQVPKSLTEREYQKLVKEVAERVWQLWRKELRYEQERRAQQPKQ